MLLSTLLLAGAQDAAAVETMVLRYRERTRAEVPCGATDRDDEIVVCARRDADRYRVPFLMPTPGDPKREGVPARTARLTRVDTPCQERGPFLIGCGMVGVSMTMGQDGRTSVETARELAP